ncbi:hypothetical protein CVT26_013963 [Gymnopilus dilepis]|uniref:Amino acid permease/ SLC12A domain-containing protein n=1 Tax=Gymnopilus dilepis TaxID=231916 RepID=A0A409X5I5_9AGAR|nr:hypothetical protein CVT26_013963 [Gymnopilus dilepis]
MNAEGSSSEDRRLGSEFSETEPLIADTEYTSNYGTEAPLLRSDASSANGNGTPSKSQRAQPKRRIGVFSAVFIIFNRLIGTGIFANPSTILAFSGSVGLSLVMWVLGSVIAAAGMQVYIIWGTALPYNGGEKNYLEWLFPRPKGLVTSIYAANAVLLESVQLILPPAASYSQNTASPPSHSPYQLHHHYYHPSD